MIKISIDLREFFEPCSRENKKVSVSIVSARCKENRDILQDYFIQISFKPSVKKIIHGINGVVNYENNFQQCHKPMKKIVSELTLLFPSAEKKDWGKYEFSEGHYFPITFDLNDLSRAMVACYNWNEESNTIDSLKVTLYSEEYQIHLSKQDQ